MSAEPSTEKSIGGHRPPLQKIVLGSRGSELARTQTAMVAQALRQAWPVLEIATQIIATRGDIRTTEPIDPRAGRKGLFTGEIERALAAGEIDVAVHSGKDLAGGQGIIALQIRSDDENARGVVDVINHAEIFSCLEAEREFLRLLQGDCGSPVGVLSTISGSIMTLRAQVFEPPRVEPRIARVEGDASKPKKLAKELLEAING